MTNRTEMMSLDLLCNDSNGFAAHNVKCDAVSLFLINTKAAAFTPKAADLGHLVIYTMLFIYSGINQNLCAAPAFLRLSV